MESQIAIIKSQDTISILEMKKVIIEQRRVSLSSMVLAGLCVLLCFGPVVEAFKPAGISSPARFHRTSFAIEAKDSKPKAPKAKVEIAKITPEEREKYFKLVDDTFISTTLTNLIDRGDIDYDPKIMNKLGKQKKKEKNTAKQLTGYNFTNYLNEESNIPFIDEPRW